MFSAVLLVRDIAAAAEATECMSLESFRTLTHIRGTRNIHLAERDGFDSPGKNHYERRTPLPLDGEVHGEFMTLDYCGHGPWGVLRDHEALADVERYILSGTGILNGFTDFVLAFVRGKQRSYEVRDGSGNVLAKDGMRVVGWKALHEADRAGCRVIWTGD
jgi:hypothetical protein